jgi:cell division protein FtsI (penicillin-binding protein 3)
VLNELKINNNTKQIQSAYACIEAKPTDEQIELKELTVSNGLVPNVIGMGAKDAVYTLEKAGLRVSLNGKGQVVSQSVAAGQRIVKGQSIALALR